MAETVPIPVIWSQLTPPRYSVPAVLTTAVKLLSSFLTIRDRQVNALAPPQVQHWPELALFRPPY